MKCIVAAFWVEDEDCEAVVDGLLNEDVPGIPGSGSTVSFGEKQARDPEFQHTLARFDLTEAAYFQRDDNDKG